MKQYSLPGYYLASSFPVRLNSAWRTRVEVAVLSLNIYVLAQDFRTLCLLDNIYLFMLSEFLPLGFHKKESRITGELFEQLLTRLLSEEHGCRLHSWITAVSSRV